MEMTSAPMLFLNNSLEMYNLNENEISHTWNQVEHYLNVTSDFVGADASPASSLIDASSNALLNSLDESLATPTTPLSPLSPQSDGSDYGPSGGSPHHHDHQDDAMHLPASIPARPIVFAPNDANPSDVVNATEFAFTAEFAAGAVAAKPAKNRSRRSRDPNKIKVERNRGACEKHKRDRKRCPLDCKNRTLFFKKK